MTLSLAAVEALVRKGIDDGLHTGAQLEVALAGRGSASLALGEARDGVAVTPDTLFPWFSCTKLLTAAAVLQQWERGRLDLDDPVARHIPEFAANGKDAVTVRHVLTHTGGFPHAGGAATVHEAGGGWDETLAQVCGASLAEGWVPGRRAGYHPRGSYFLLGEIVQRLDGRPFDAYVSEELFEPLGMADAWMALSPERYDAYGERMAVMPVTVGGKRAPLSGLDGRDAFSRVSPDGGAVGPMRDLVRVPLMLLGHGALEGVRVLSPQTVEAMCARHRVHLMDETFGAVIDWGLGTMVNSWYYRSKPAPYGYGDHASMRACGHGWIQSSVAFCDPEHGLAVALVFNGRPGEPAHHRRVQPVLNALYEDLLLTRPAGSTPA